MQDEACRVHAAGFGVQGVGLQLKPLRCSMQGLGCREWDTGQSMQGAWPGVQTLGQGVPAPLHSFPTALLQHPLPVGTAAKSIRRGCCRASPVCLKGLQPSGQLAPLSPCHPVPLGAG